MREERALVTTTFWSCCQVTVMHSMQAGYLEKAQKYTDKALMQLEKLKSKSGWVGCMVTAPLGEWPSDCLGLGLKDYSAKQSPWVPARGSCYPSWQVRVTWGQDRGDRALA